MLASGDEALTGRHLTEFLDFVHSKAERWQDAEKNLLGQQSDTNKPANYASKLKDAGIFAHIYESLEESARARAGQSNPILTLREVSDIIKNYKGGKGEIEFVGSSEDRVTDLLAQNFAQHGKAMMQVPSGADSGLSLIKMQVRETTFHHFLALYCHQTDKVDQWITEEILKQHNSSQPFCVKGKVNTALLNQRRFPILDTAEKLCESTGNTYLNQLVFYNGRKISSLTEVYERAELQYRRSDFEVAVASAYSGLGEHRLRQKQEALLEGLAHKCGLNLKALTSSIDF